MELFSGGLPLSGLMGSYHLISTMKNSNTFHVPKFLTAAQLFMLNSQLFMLDLFELESRPCLVYCCPDPDPDPDNYDDQG